MFGGAPRSGVKACEGEGLGKLLLGGEWVLVCRVRSTRKKVTRVALNPKPLTLNL